MPVNKMRPQVFIIILFSAQILSCNNTGEKTVINRKPKSEEIEKLNSYLVQKDRERIQSYGERKNLSLRETPSGLWYLIKNEGKGKLFADNDRIEMEYECYLLDGTRCYSSKDKGPRDLILGKGEIETGLLEGLKMLRPGGEAIFIIPSFLAYGIVGDGKAIPPRAIIVYEVKAETGKK
jgi:FKBP-type peptidyl-prolyl cis-trans isomerase